MPHKKQNQFRAAELSFSRSSLADSFQRHSVPDHKPVRDWWAHLRRGLIIEPTAKHHRQMRQAVWLYLYLLLNADGRTGMLFRRLATISQDTGIARRTIRRWFSALRRYEYISAQFNGSFWQITINKWRPISRYPRKNRNWLDRFKQNFLSARRSRS
jgi:hypothetical protein